MECNSIDDHLVMKYYVKTWDSQFKSSWVANQKIIFFIYLFIIFLECGLIKKEKYNIKEINIMTWSNFMWFEYLFLKIKI